MTGIGRIFKQMISGTADGVGRQDLLHEAAHEEGSDVKRVKD